jgi:hypothetical protein
MSSWFVSAVSNRTTLIALGIYFTLWGVLAQEIRTYVQWNPITPEGRPRIVTIAKRTSVRLTLELRYHSRIYRLKSFTSMARSSSEKLSRGSLNGYDDSALTVDDEFVNYNTAPIHSQDFPIESTIRTASGTAKIDLKFRAPEISFPHSPISVAKEALFHLRTRQEPL